MNGKYDAPASISMSQYHSRRSASKNTSCGATSTCAPRLRHRRRRESGDRETRRDADRFSLAGAPGGSQAPVGSGAVRARGKVGARRRKSRARTGNPRSDRCPTASRSSCTGVPAGADVRDRRRSPPAAARRRASRRSRRRSRPRSRYTRRPPPRRQLCSVPSLVDLAHPPERRHDVQHLRRRRRRGVRDPADGARPGDLDAAFRPARVAVLDVRVSRRGGRNSRKRVVASNQYSMRR